MSDNAEKIAKLRKEADELEAADRAFQALPDEYKLAITLHGMLCRWNHTDGCGWFYEIVKGVDNWNGSAHEPYLTKARHVIAFCNRNRNSITTDDAINLLKLVKE